MMTPRKRVEQETIEVQETHASSAIRLIKFFGPQYTIIIAMLVGVFYLLFHFGSLVSERHIRFLDRVEESQIVQEKILREIVTSNENRTKILEGLRSEQAKTTKAIEALRPSI